MLIVSMRLHLMLHLVRLFFALLLAGTHVEVAAADAATFSVGSKRFTESYVLAEIIRQRAQARARRAPSIGRDSAIPPSC